MLHTTTPAQPTRCTAHDESSVDATDINMVMLFPAASSADEAVAWKKLSEKPFTEASAKSSMYRGNTAGASVSAHCSPYRRRTAGNDISGTRLTQTTQKFIAMPMPRNSTEKASRRIPSACSGSPSVSDPDEDAALLNT